jgi:hypothetical protein
MATPAAGILISSDLQDEFLNMVAAGPAAHVRLPLIAALIVRRPLCGDS